MSHEMEGCGLHKKEKWRGYAQVFLSSSLRQDRRGETVGRERARPWAPAPLVHGNARGGGENGEEAEGVRLRPSPRAETVYGGLSTEMGGGRQW
jgi:hypothetical protein